MFNFKDMSLYRKLILAFFIVGFFPFIIFFIYTLYWGEQKILDKIMSEQSIQAQNIIDSIELHLNSLHKDIVFLAQLDIMDDIVSEDIDKRISRVLLQKKGDISTHKKRALHVELEVINANADIVSSSEINSIGKKFKSFDLLKSDKSFFIIDEELYVSSKIDASFDMKKTLGYLVLRYDLKNIDKFFTHQEGVYNALYNPAKELVIGKNIPFHVEFKHDSDSYIDDKYLVVYKKLNYVLDNWYFVYIVDRDLALDFLYDFIRFMVLMIPLALALTLIIGLLSAKNIVRPIELLTEIAENITNTKDYSATVQIDSHDEIGRLSFAFNELLHTTSSALKTLEEENRLRLKRFIKLIEIFNTIITTKSESECIEISLKEIEKLTNTAKLHFIEPPKLKENSIAIYVSDFDHEEKILFGSIALDMKLINDENEEKFYYSIVSMISLQLDRIRLIDKTMSASRAKSAFISNMSHELRTPLNAIIGFTQYLIAYEELNEEQQEIISNIENSAQYLLEMINGILDIAKIESGKMEAGFEECSIKTLLNETMVMLRPLCEQKSLQLDLHVESLKNEPFKTDPKLFKQIIINLISNAVKFTQKGAIRVTAVQDNDHITIKIKDSGIGISSDDLSKLFNDFTQVENVMQKKHKGTGLGLSLSKKLAKLLHGDVILRSNGLGKGSEAIFTFTQN